MRCERCGRENQGSMTFCLGCGTRLGQASATSTGAFEPAAEAAPVVCERCQQPNRPTYRFCLSCGHPLGEAGASKGAGPPVDGSGAAMRPLEQGGPSRPGPAPPSMTLASRQAAPSEPPPPSEEARPLAAMPVIHLGPRDSSAPGPGPQASAASPSFQASAASLQAPAASHAAPPAARDASPAPGPVRASSPSVPEARAASPSAPEARAASPSVPAMRPPSPSVLPPPAAALGALPTPPPRPATTPPPRPATTPPPRPATTPLPRPATTPPPAKASPTPAPARALTPVPHQAPAPSQTRQSAAPSPPAKSSPPPADASLPLLPGDLPRCPRCQTPAMMGQLFCRSCGFALDLSPAEATTKAVASFFLRPDGAAAGAPDEDVLATVVNRPIPADVVAANAAWSDEPTSNASAEDGAEAAGDDGGDDDDGDGDDGDRDGAEAGDEPPAPSELPSPSAIALDHVMAAHGGGEAVDVSDDSTIPVPAKMRALAAQTAQAMQAAQAAAGAGLGASPAAGNGAEHVTPLITAGPSFAHQRPTVNVSVAKKASVEAGSRQAERSTPTAPYGRLLVYIHDSAAGTPFALETSPFDIGSREGQVRLGDDPYVAPLHARLELEGGQWYLADLGSLNGVYRRLAPSVELGDGDLILLGQQVLRFELVMDAERALRPAYQHGVALFGTPPAARFARLCQRTVEGVTRDVMHMGRDELTLGREGTDLAFPDDGFLSRRHAILRRDASSGRFTLEDLGSSNGTFVSVRGRVPVRDGDIFRLGLHLLRAEVTAPGAEGGAGPSGARAGAGAGEGGSA